ncbi:MAG: prepilin-type N-terminal cleavage/methylation domain-containing protein [Acidobacteria bacterium]|nr:prepilin-type N-terminal cleavage/methylation domain-containing protein [Acidobacteriota bacterium]
MRLRSRGFTLLEMVLALSLMTLVLTTTMLFFSSTLRTRNAGEKLAQRTQLERVLLRQMAREISQARVINTYEKIGAQEKGFGGKLKGIEMLTYVLPRPERFAKRDLRDIEVPAEFDLRRVIYYLIRADKLEDEDGNPRVFGLARHEFKLRNRQVSIEGEEYEERVELIAPEIKYLSFRFFDGASWTSRWEGSDQDSLPQTVRVTIGRNPLPDDEQYFESIADAKRFGIAQWKWGQTVDLNLQQGQIDRRIRADDPGDFFRPVAETDLDLIRVLNDMVVRQDVAVVADDEPGALADPRPLWCSGFVPRITEEESKQVFRILGLAVVLVFVAVVPRGNADHRIHRVRDDVGKVADTGIRGDGGRQVDHGLHRG